MPTSASRRRPRRPDAASTPFDGGTPQQQVSQYQRELDKAMKAAAQHTADQAASAGDDGTR